ncbi:hypothetical protein FHX83_005235 [Clostridium beijerinckii]|nr:hypothetical protein [Clostridium beijerinckii]
MDPTKDIPEKPDPSNPVIAPTTVSVPAEIVEFIGTLFASAAPKSLTMPFEPSGSIFPNISVNAESPK